MPEGLPEGRVTFLFTDVEGSTRLLEEHAAVYGAGIARHHELLEAAVESAGGVVFETIGDAVYAAFADPTAAVDAARAAQLALADEDWGPLGAMRVRMGLHTGEVERRGSHYFGPALYRCARLTSIAHGQQVVLSDATAELVRTRDGGWSLRDLGQHRLSKMISGVCAMLMQDISLAREWSAEAMDEFELLGDSWSRASGSMSLAFALIQLGELDEARAALEGSIETLTDVGDLKMANACAIAEAMIERFSGDNDAAAAAYARALELCVDGGDPANAPVCLEGIAAASLSTDPERAARLLGVARSLFDAGMFPTVPVFEVFYDATWPTVQDVLGPDSAEREHSLGRASTKGPFRLSEAANV